MKKTSIDPDLLALIKSNGDKAFTIPMLRDAYQAMANPKHKTAKAAQHYIYKILLRLEANGMVLRLPSKLGRTDQYKLMQNADEDSVSPLPELSSTKQQNHKVLHDRLNQYKTEMLIVLGEAEEYEAIYKEIPMMQVNLQKRYDLTRDLISTLSGKIRAIENLMSDFGHA